MSEQKEYVAPALRQPTDQALFDACNNVCRAANRVHWAGWFGDEEKSQAELTEKLAALRALFDSEKR